MAITAGYGLEILVEDARPNVGFGTAWLPKDDVSARALLRLAVECGIRYFDTARMYGSGTAEGHLGAVLRELSHDLRRDITIATKLGITPQSNATSARALRKCCGILGLAAPAFTRPHFGAFSPREMSDSLETSLRLLGNCPIDILLLHEVAPGHLRDDALRFLEDAAGGGKFKRLGIATGLAESQEILRNWDSVIEVVQIADNAWQDNRARVPNSGQMFVTHSLLNDRFTRLRIELAGDVRARREWSQALDFDATEPGALGGVFLRYALAANPAGYTLFSTTNPAHLRSNARWAALGPLSELQCARLKRLIAQ